MKRNITSVAVVLGAVAALTAAAATPANASADTLAQCPNGNVCMWVDGPFSGAPTSYGAPAFSNLNPHDHDEVSSWANKTSFTYCLYDNGTSVILDVLGPGSSRGVMRSGTNDKADAFGRCG
jgi:hypothetical protein